MTAQTSAPLHAITPPKRASPAGSRVRVVRAGWFRPDAGGFFGVVPRPLWCRFVAETDERGRVLCRLNLLLVEADGKRLLVETGTGVRMTDKDRDIKGVEGGDPAEALRAVGEDPAAIDFVVVSHLHYDHAGGMVDADGRPNFPNARLRRAARRGRGRPRRRAARAGDHGGRAARPGARCRPAGRGQRARWSWCPASECLPTGGHTRGSQAVLLGVDGPGAAPATRRDRAVFWGDLIPTRWQIPVRWTSAFDDYPIDAVEMRNELVARAPPRAGGAISPTTPATCPSRSRLPTAAIGCSRPERVPVRRTKAGRIPWSRHPDALRSRILTSKGRILA